MSFSPLELPLTCNYSFSEDGSTLTLSGEVKRSWSSSSPQTPQDKPDTPTQDKEKSTENTVSKKQEQAESAPHYSERFYGSFSRSVRFPSLIDAEKTSAALKDGVLTVTVPKRAAQGVKSISIE
jgi:HSP20 family protein